MFQKDNHDRYGTVSRFLHWGMALLIVWQFLSAASHFFFEDTAIEAFFWPTHKPLGVLLLLLVILRFLWALINLKNRPPAVNALSKLGHLSIYLLLIAVPVIGLIRQYGTGRVFEPFGIPVFAGFEGDMIKWMLDLGGTWHGELGWVLLALIVGHILMALKHRNTSNDVMPRMKGK
jgi:cytochrome b561